MATSKNAGSRVGKRRRIMRALKINEISAVDVPAQEGAVAVIMKRRDAKPGSATDIPNADDLDVEKGAALTTDVNGHTHLLVLKGYGGDEHNSGMTTWVDGHAHPWVRTEEDDIIIGTAGSEEGEPNPHTHEVGQLSKLSDDDAAGLAGNNVGIEEDDTMTDTTQKAADEAKIAELEAQLKRTTSIAALNDAHKTHFTGLEGDAADEFLAKSADERQTVIDGLEKASKEDDPVVYTTADGIELRKSTGEAFIAIAKSNDALRKDNEELREGREQDALEKRADVELSHLPGTVQDRAAMLKAIDGIEDEDKRKAAHSALKAQNESMAKAFETAGVNDAPAPGSPDEELDRLAKAHSDKEGVTVEAAYAVVLETQVGKDLYAKTVQN